MWIGLGFVSMLFLGFYDLSKKHALTQNAVLPTLFFSNLAGVGLTVPVLLGSIWVPDVMQSYGLYSQSLTAQGHGLLALKSLIVGASWICAFFAMKHLPISIVSPIRASGPMWTLAGAIFLFHEQPSTLQWVGMAFIFVSYFIFSLLGRKEGIHFHRSKWIGLVFLATVISSASGLMDKWLIQRQSLEVMQVLPWYSLYLFVFFALVNGLLWWPNRHKTTPFRWRWTIPMIGILLVLSDYVYFRALTHPEAMIVILSILRRSSVLIGFFVGAVLFKEVNKRKKAWVLLGIMVGVVLILISG